MKPTNNKFQNPTRKDWVSGIAWLLTYVLVIGAGALFLIPEYWYWWVLLFAVSTVFIIIKQNRNVACRCRECGHEFEVSFLANVFAFHGVDKEGSWQYAKCPNCKKRVKTTVIKVRKGG